MCLPYMCVPKMCMHAHAHKPPWPVTMPHRGLWEKKIIFFFVLISLSKFVPFPMPYCHLGSMPHVAWQPPSPPSLPMYINHCCIESPVCESLLYCKEYVTYIVLTYEVRQLSLSFQKKVSCYPWDSWFFRCSTQCGDNTLTQSLAGMHVRTRTHQLIN